LSHYLFADRFGRPGKGNDKGKVENLVKIGRRQFLTPVPTAESYEALNAKLAADCRARQADCSGRNRRFTFLFVDEPQHMSLCHCLPGIPMHHARSEQAPR
jgi:hypothetical protein